MSVVNMTGDVAATPVQRIIAIPSVSVVMLSSVTSVISISTRLFVESYATVGVGVSVGAPDASYEEMSDQYRSSGSGVYPVRYRSCIVPLGIAAN